MAERPESGRLHLMREVFVPREAWVLSGSMLGWGDAVVEECDAVVFLTLDSSERMRRLEPREAQRRQSADAGRASSEAFLAWASGYDDPTFEGRSRASHEAWLSRLRKPVLRLDSEPPPESLRDSVLTWEP